MMEMPTANLDTEQSLFLQELPKTFENASIVSDRHKVLKAFPRKNGLDYGMRNRLAMTCGVMDGSHISFTVRFTFMVLFLG